MAITLRGVTLGAGRAKILVPVLAQTIGEAVRQAAALAQNPAAELVELRLDPLLPGQDAVVCLRAVRAALGEAKPLLATYRTSGQGGALAAGPEAYAARVAALPAAAPLFDLLDLEWCAGAARCAALAAQARRAGLATVFSYHDFSATPPAAAMTALLTAMADAGADIAKLAVMPAVPADAAALLEATAAARAARPATPLITMSMGPLGAVTRVCGGAFGSAATCTAVRAG